MRYLSFDQLREAGYVRNRSTLHRWINQGLFPPPMSPGPNTRAWSDKQLQEVDRRAAAGITTPNPAWLKALAILKEAHSNGQSD